MGLCNSVYLYVNQWVRSQHTLQFTQIYIELHSPGSWQTTIRQNSTHANKPFATIGGWCKPPVVSYREKIGQQLAHQLPSLAKGLTISASFTHKNELSFCSDDKRIPHG